jgi:hypothetical protein
MAFAGPGKLLTTDEAIMKKLALMSVLAFALTTGMAGVTIFAHTDQAMADGGSCTNC